MTAITIKPNASKKPPMTRLAVRCCSGLGRVMPNVSMNISVR